MISSNPTTKALGIDRFEDGYVRGYVRRYILEGMLVGLVNLILFCCPRVVFCQNSTVFAQDGEDPLTSFRGCTSIYECRVRTRGLSTSIRRHPGGRTLGSLAVPIGWLYIRLRLEAHARRRQQESALMGRKDLDAGLLPSRCCLD